MDLQLSKFAISQYIKKYVKNIFEKKNPLNSTVLLLKVIYSMETLKVAITQVAMEIQL